LDLDVPVGLTYLSDIDQDGLGLFADVTLGQLLTHTHGLDGEAIEFRTAYTGDFTSNIFWNLIGKVEAAENGHAFDYSNFGYVAASYILEHIYNENWQTLVERTVLAPAGMTETVFQVSGLLGKPYAMPHRWMGTTQQIPVYKRDNTMHAAGGQFSTGRDMTRWLKLNINDGRIDGRQVLPASAVALTTAPLATLDQEFYSFRRETYGLGWYDSDYEGERLMHHFGAYSGYRAHISMMPRIGLGISILSNDLSPPSMNLPDMIAAYVYDIALGKENVDEKFDQQIAALAERMAPYVGRTMPERPRNAPDNESEFAGVFENDIWGVWELREDSNVLRMHWGNSVSDLTYTERDGEKLLRFEVAGNGYLARPVWRESGALDGLIFRDSLFKRQ
jgi:CubicO group peptidase (beta-lactamase class C family)